MKVIQLIKSILHEDVTLQENIRHINRELVKKRIIEGRDYKRAFRIMEMQLAFLSDYFNTRYPMIFWFGLCSLFLCLLHSVATVGVVCWVSVDILAHMVHTSNKVDMIVTLAFMLFVVFKEMWEMVVYLLSDWTRLLLVCMYASMDNKRVRNSCLERLILCFFRSKISTKRWHGLLDQYVFVQYYDHKPKLWNLTHKVTTGMVTRKDDGAELSSAIDVPEYVWPQVLEKLSEILRHDEDERPRPQGPAATAPSTDDSYYRYYMEESVDRHGCHLLPKKLVTLPDGRGGRKEKYGWACFGLQTSSHVILVWHIATSICEMALAMEHSVDLSKSNHHGFLRYLVSCFTCCCSSTKPYLIDVDDDEHKEESCSIARRPFTSCFSSKPSNKLEEGLRRRYIVANSLSRYCAYLLVSKPEVIPDSFLVPKMVFQDTVKTACDGILNACDSLQSRYEMLLEIARSDFPDSIKEGDDVLKQGAVLAKDLLESEDQEERWDILSGVWTELLIHMAPTWNADAHRTYLESGGEFITYIWALLWHCNIDKSCLWPEYDASSDEDEDAATAAAAPHDNGGGGGNNINPLMGTQQEDGAYASNHQNATEIHEERAIQGTGRGAREGNQTYNSLQT